MIDETIIRAFVILAVSVAVIAAMFFLLKKFQGKMPGRNNSINLKILSKVPLQARTSLYIVRAGNRVLLIGVSEKNIATLADLTSDAVKQKNKTSSGENPNEQSSNPSKPSTIEEENNVNFASFLRSSLKKYN